MPMTQQRTETPLGIILVEDDDGDAKAVRRALAKAQVPLTLIRTRDGVDALAFIRGETGAPPPHYILLVDLNMPRMNGLELLAEIRNDPHLARAIVFVMTTSRDEHDKNAAFSHQAAGYLVKANVGTDFHDLVGIIEHYVRGIEVPDMERSTGALS